MIQFLVNGSLHPHRRSESSSQVLVLNQLNSSHCDIFRSKSVDENLAVFLSFSLSLSWIQPCPQPVLLHLGNAPVFIKISVNLPPFLTLCIPNQLINQLINIKQITKHETFSSQHFAPGPKIYCSQKCLVLQLLLWLGSKILVLFTVERIETFFIL